MKKKCCKCNALFQTHIKVGNKWISSSIRKSCYDCTPYLGNDDRRNKPSGRKCICCGDDIPKYYTLDNGEKIKVGTKRNRCFSCYKRYDVKKGGHTAQELKVKNQKRRMVYKKECVDRKGGKCEKCGYNRSISALDFHHIDNKTKKNNISEMIIDASRNGKWNECKYAVFEEIEKCQLLCATCHREVEFIEKFGYLV